MPQVLEQPNADAAWMARCWQQKTGWLRRPARFSGGHGDGSDFLATAAADMIHRLS